jgi:hypothetical protein
MATIRVGMREFRSKLAQYLLEADTPLAITRHGDTVIFQTVAVRHPVGIEGLHGTPQGVSLEWFRGKGGPQ